MPDLPPPPAGPPPAFLTRIWHVASERWPLLRPPELSGVPAARAVVGAAIGVVVLVVAGLVAWVAWGVLGAGATPSAPVELSMPSATPSSSTTVGALTGGSADVSGSRDSLAGASGEAIVVHVAGAVASPGLYRLAAGARVDDAIAAAGGAVGDADLDAVNLAAKVQDGDRVYVPRQGEVASPSPAGIGSRSSTPQLPLDLNAATESQLDQLPGVGPATAAAIVEYRNQHGRFRSVDELGEVRGIGPAKLESLRPKVRVR